MSAETDIESIIEYNPIAVVGCSRTPGKAAHDVPRFMLEHGYTIVPVNPFVDEIFGVKSFPSLAAVDVDIPLVNVSRPSDETDEVISIACAREDVEAIWLQLGISNGGGKHQANKACKKYVENRCLKVEYQRHYG